MATSRQHARELIENRRVTVGGAPAHKATRQVASAEALVVTGPPPRYVGRGGLKLEGALATFALDPTGATALDAGSSTGGFTDCLLQAGAARVVAVDVGTNQLHERLLADPRVDSRENTDIRSLTRATIKDEYDVADGFDVIVADLSFISATSLLDTFAHILATDGDLVVLVKPQFEAGRPEVSKGRGVIRDPAVWQRVLHGFIDAAAEIGLHVADLAISPIRGGKGNIEFLAHVRRGDILTTDVERES